MIVSRRSIERLGAERPASASVVSRSNDGQTLVHDRALVFPRASSVRGSARKQTGRPALPSGPFVRLVGRVGAIPLASRLAAARRGKDRSGDHSLASPRAKIEAT
ncbi:MAG: hypothetical protein BGO98_08455 [Myxococcales bacterium 68-20]|nr:MAG: hypothetical protein BGO98_08455 [Myxococcales bacterium 68-20]